MNKIKNKLFENINYFNKKDNIIKEGVEFITDNEGNKHYFRDDDVICYAFGYLDNNLIISNNHGTHGEAIRDYLNMKDRDINVDYVKFDNLRKNLKYEGRLWITFETISLREIVSNNVINDLKQDFKKYFPNKDFSNFKIEMGRTLSYA